jgi:hypothetical protein
MDNELREQLNGIQADVRRLVVVLDEFLPMMRKAAAIKAMNPAAKVREAMAKRGNTRSLPPGSNESGGEGGSVTRRIVPDTRPGGIGESD